MLELTSIHDEDMHVTTITKKLNWIQIISIYVSHLCDFSKYNHSFTEAICFGKKLVHNVLLFIKNESIIVLNGCYVTVVSD